MESGYHLTTKYAEALSKAIWKMGYDVVYGVATEPLKDTVRHWRISTSPKDLCDFSRETAHFNFAMIPEDGGFVVILTTSDYLIIAGPEEFVSLACGDVDAARVAFGKFAFDARTRSIATRFGRH